jgi:hypothetical protein
MSTTVSMRPTTDIGTNGAWSFTGGPTTVFGTTADNLDSTFAQAGGTTAAAIIGFGPFTMPAGAQIRSVTVKARLSSATAGKLFTASITYSGAKKANALTSGSVPPTAATDYTWVQPRTADGGNWTAAEINRIQFSIAAQNPIRFYRLELLVVYNEQPVVSSVTPSGGSSTSRFTVGWTYTDPDGDAQERWRAKVFDDPLPSGFNPETAIARVDSGSAYIGKPGATSWQLPKALPPGGYWIYVKASDQGSNGRYSEWASTSVVLAGTPPAPPKLLSATADSAAGRVVLTVEQTDNLLTWGEFGGEEQTGGLLRWAAVSGISAGPSVVAGAGNGGTNGIQATVNAATAVFTTPTGVRGRMVVGGRQYAISGLPKNSAAAGTAHLDAIWYNSAGTVVGGTSVGSTVTLATTFGNASTVTINAPATAAYVALQWTFAGLTTGQVVTVDENGIREDSSSSNRYRGGLDSTNLLDPNDSTINSSVVSGSSWTIVGTGTLLGGANAAAYDGFDFRVSPGTVGASHILKLGQSVVLPVEGGEPNANYQFQAQGRAQAGTNLKVTLMFYFKDDSDTVVGAPVSVGTATLPGTTYVPVFGSANAPDGATKLEIQLVLFGEVATTDRWAFDQMGVVRVPDNWFFQQPWKPSSQVDTYAIVEFSDDSGATWDTVRYTETSLYDPTSRQAFVFDYEAPPNVARQYRARTGARDYQIDPLEGADLSSGPSGVLSATLTVTDFYVVDPQDLVRLVLPQIGDITLSSPMPQGRFDPLGRKYAVTVSDVPKGEDITLRLAFNSQAEFDAFESLRLSQHVLFIQTPGQRSWYVTLGGPRAATWGMGTMKDGVGGKYTVEVPAIETARPD